ncbi:MAG: hypothetical protein GY841_06435 [FCB group bacterium]|nr:hypothetical protein [FCB group bacterium]
MRFRSRSTSILFPLLCLLLFAALSVKAGPADDNSLKQGERTSRFSFLSISQSPGTQVGETTHDLQHYGTMGRQIAHRPITNFVHMVWTAQDAFEIPGNRHVNYQAYDPSMMDYILSPGGIVVWVEYGAFTTCDANSDGGGILAYMSTYMGDTSTYFCEDFMPGAGFFLETEINSGWPIIAYHDSAVYDVTESVVYVLTRLGDGSNDMVLFRRIGTSSFDYGTYIETCTNLSFTVVADPASDQVAIIYTDDRVGQAEGSGGEVDLDVYYMISEDQGHNWSPPICITNYTIDSLWRAYTDLSAVFDSYSNLSITWAARKLPTPGDFSSDKSRLMYWNSGIGAARIITEATYTMTSSCDPGNWNLYISKPSISACDGNLYALWTQFGDYDPDGLADCSQHGFANGELYMSGSDDDGYTWDLPQNLTQTRSPACDSAECQSEHWSSMALYGMYDGGDDTLDILYIEDTDAGSIIDGEGTWTLNPVMHLRTGCRSIVHAPRLIVSSELPITTSYPSTYDLVLENIGNASLSYSLTISYDYGYDWIYPSQTAGTIPSGDFNSETIHLDIYPPVDMPYNKEGYANIEITSNAPDSPKTTKVTDSSDVKYKDSTGTGIADYQQKPGKGVCLEVAVTNCFWYWDHHGHAGVIPHSNGDPGDWEDDGQDVITKLEDGIRTKKKGGAKGVADYIKGKGKYWKAGANDGLIVTMYSGDAASYSNFEKELKRCQDVIPYFKAHDAGEPAGTWVKVGPVGKKRDWYHAQTAAGWDDAEPPSKVVTTNGWRNSAGAQAENAKVVAGENYEVCDIQNPTTNGDKLRVTNSPQAGIPPAGSDYLEMVKMMTICPLGKNEKAPKGKGIVSTTRQGRLADVYQFCAHSGEYETDILEPIYHFAISIDVPFNYSSLNVQSPSGWSAEEWIPANTPGLSPVPPFLDPDDFDAVDTNTPDWRGIIWTTTTHPVMPDDSLCGFSYELTGYDTSHTASYNALSSHLNDTSGITWYGHVLGPVSTSCCTMPGDANNDGSVNVGDAVYMINYVFKSGPAPDCLTEGDANGDCTLNVGDAVYLINYVFKGGDPPICDDMCEWPD